MPRRVLVVEPDLEQVMRLEHVFAESQRRRHPEVHIVGTLDEALGRMADEEYEVAVVEPSLSEPGDLEVIRTLAGARTSMAIVVLTEGDDSLVKPCLEAGAHTYIPKDDLSVRTLWRAIDAAMTIAAAHTRLAASIDQLEATTTDLRAAMAEANELEDLIALVAHDLREPIRTARVFVDRAQTDRANRQRWTSRVEASLEHMNTMSERLLDYLALRRDQPEPRRCELKDVGRIVTESLDVELRRTDGKLEWPADDAVYCAPDLLIQSLRELVANGLLYGPHDGTPRVTVTSEPVDESVIVRIADNGCGMEPRYWKRALKPLERLTSEGDGVGLGLPTAARSVQVSSGELAIESSDAGQGTIVRVRMPAARPPVGIG